MSDLSAEITAALRELPQPEPRQFLSANEAPRRYSETLAERVVDDIEPELEAMFRPARPLQQFANGGRSRAR